MYTAIDRSIDRAANNSQDEMSVEEEDCYPRRRIFDLTHWRRVLGFVEDQVSHWKLLWAWPLLRLFSRTWWSSWANQFCDWSWGSVWMRVSDLPCSLSCRLPWTTLAAARILLPWTALPSLGTRVGSHARARCTTIHSGLKSWLWMFPVSNALGWCRWWTILGLILCSQRRTWSTPRTFNQQWMWMIARPSSCDYLPLLPYSLGVWELARRGWYFAIVVRCLKISSTVSSAWNSFARSVKFECSLLV